MAKVITQKKTHEFSIEDLEGGVYGKSNESSIDSIAYVNKLGLLDAVVDSSPDSVSFSVESARLLGEADVFGQFASRSIEQLAYEVAIISKIKKDFGIEGLNPYTFGAEGGVWDKIKATAKKIWEAIKSAFRRIVQAISNFIRSVLNTLGSAAFKGQDALYKAYKNNTDLYNKSNAKAKIPTYSEKSDFADLLSFINTLASQMVKKCSTLDANVLKTVMPTIDNRRDEVAGDIAADLNSGNPAADQANALALTIKAIENEWAKGQGGKRRPIPAREWAIVKVYGNKANAKPTEKPIAKFVTQRINDLSIEHANRMKLSVKVCQTILKASNMSLKVSEKASQMADKLSGLNKQAADGKIDNKAARLAARESKKQRAAQGAENFVREIYGNLMGRVLNVFSLYIKYRSYLAIALKAMRGNGGKVKKTKVAPTP